MRQLQFIRTNQKIDTEASSQVAIINSPYNKDDLITIGYDSLIKSLDKNSLNELKIGSIKSPYPRSIASFEGKLLVGISLGYMLILDENFQIQKQYLIHTDCITSIIVLPDQIITSSMDGDVHFLNRQSFEKKNTVSFETPINFCVLSDGQLYIASRPSFKLELSNLKVTKLANYTQIIKHKGRVFGCSDEEGIVCLSDGITMPIPCQFMISFGEKILICNGYHQEIGFLFYENPEEIRWVMNRFDILDKGCSILSGLAEQNNVYLSGEGGKIYHFAVKIQNDAK